MRINDFRSQLGAGGARPNQFQVKLNLPGNVGLGDHNLLVTGAAAPASTVNPAIIQYRGREVKFAGERIFDPWTVTIVNGTDFKIRDEIEAWMDAMNDRELNNGDIRLADYTSDIVVEHLDRNDGILGTWELMGAFPINMSEIALQYAQNDILEEFTVTFQYQYYTWQKGNGGKQKK